VRGERTDLPGVEEEQIHVGGEGHLAPRVSTHGDEAHPRSRPASIGVMPGFGQAVEPAQEPVEGVGVDLVDRPPRFPGGLPGDQEFPNPGEIGAGARRRFGVLGFPGFPVWNELGKEAIDRRGGAHRAASATTSVFSRR
jgi:hypothetical protein